MKAEEFNKVTIQTLKSRGDHISLNAVKMIEEMQEEAINYTRCCETLPCNYAEGYNDAIAKIKEEAKYISRENDLQKLTDQAQDLGLGYD